MCYIDGRKDEQEQYVWMAFLKAELDEARTNIAFSWAHWRQSELWIWLLLLDLVAIIIKETDGLEKVLSDRAEEFESAGGGSSDLWHRGWRLFPSQLCCTRCGRSHEVPWPRRPKSQQGCYPPSQRRGRYRRVDCC